MTPTPLAQALGDLDEVATVGLVGTKLASGETPLLSWRSSKPV